MLKVFCFLLTVILSGCSSVTVRTDGSGESYTEATYQQRYNYWWFGLYGEHTVNVREVCQGRDLIQAQSVDTLADMTAALFTLGIYTPRTAKVWCGDK